MNIFYQPKGAWAADFIPLYDKDEFVLFYLHDWRDPKNFGEGTPWYQIRTNNLIHFEEMGEILPRGKEDEQDLYVFTGSAIKAGEKYHIFYTGHNPYFPKAGKPAQAVMHAVSDDRVHWQKIPEDTFFAPQDTYEPDDWRDPFVFWNPEAGQYWMLLAARLRTGPSRRRGCTALCTSKDLKHWTVQPPFWTPGLYYTHECPDCFKIGDWWYLLFSEFSERCVTRYRMSRSLSGPWITPANDTFDGRAFYAAKTASNGRQRYLFGWVATREQAQDYHGWQWGGSLVVHEVLQNPDGTLRVQIPESIKNQFASPQSFQISPRLGSAVLAENYVHLDGTETFACATLGPLPSRCKIEMTIQVEAGASGCGLALRLNDDLETGYFIRLEPARNRLVFDAWPRPGDNPFMVELERPIQVEPGSPIRLTVLIEGSICVVYADNSLAMSARMYDHPQGQWGIFVQQGAATFNEISISGA